MGASEVYDDHDAQRSPLRFLPADAGVRLEAVQDVWRHVEPTTSPTPVLEPVLVAAAPAPPVPAPVSVPLPPLTEIQASFLDGYRAGGGDPAWEEHLVNDVIPCESGWSVETGGGFQGLAQFEPGAWESAKCSPDADWRSPWEQGCAVARWMAAIAPNWGTTAGWPACWWRGL